MADDVLQVFDFAFDRCTDNAQSVPEEALHLFGDTKLEIPVKLHALELMGESRDIDMSPLAAVAIKWNTLWRLWPNPRDAISHFREVFDDEWINDQFTATVHRLKINAQLEVEVKKKSGRRGRRPKSDRAADLKLWQDWQAAKVNGSTLAEFCRDRDIKQQDAVKAFARRRERRRRAQ